jgi:hypothetical protein
MQKRIEKLQCNKIVTAKRRWEQEKIYQNDIINRAVNDVALEQEKCGGWKRL